MKDETEETRICQILEDYRDGKLDKYEAMDALDLDNLRELLDLLARHGVGPELSRDYFQSEPSARPAQDYFTDGDQP
jgi:hypothetical protein